MRPTWTAHYLAYARASPDAEINLRCSIMLERGRHPRPSSYFEDEHASLGWDASTSKKASQRTKV